MVRLLLPLLPLLHRLFPRCQLIRMVHPGNPQPPLLTQALARQVPTGLPPTGLHGKAEHQYRAGGLRRPKYLNWS